MILPQCSFCKKEIAEDLISVTTVIGAIIRLTTMVLGMIRATKLMVVKTVRAVIKHCLARTLLKRARRILARHHVIRNPHHAANGRGEGRRRKFQSHHNECDAKWRKGRDGSGQGAAGQAKDARLWLEGQPGVSTDPVRVREIRDTTWDVVGYFSPRENKGQPCRAPS